MAQQPDELLALCTACGKPQSRASHLCEHCGAPLTAFAHTDWVLGIQSRGFAAYQATHAPRKLIVVIGMWMWMLPMLCVGLLMGFTAAGGLLESYPKGLWEIALALLLMSLGTGLVLLSGMILVRTTYTYFHQLPSAGSMTRNSQVAEVADAVEPIECLACGTEFASTEQRCPQCGWSFQDA